MVCDPKACNRVWTAQAVYFVCGICRSASMECYRLDPCAAVICHACAGKWDARRHGTACTKTGCKVPLIYHVCKGDGASTLAILRREINIGRITPTIAFARWTAFSVRSKNLASDLQSQFEWWDEKTRTMITSLVCGAFRLLRDTRPSAAGEEKQIQWDDLFPHTDRVWVERLKLASAFRDALVMEARRSGHSLSGVATRVSTSPSHPRHQHSPTKSPAA